MVDQQASTHLLFLMSFKHMLLQVLMLLHATQEAQVEEVMIS